MMPLRLLFVLGALAASSGARAASEAMAPVRVLALKAKTAHVQGIDTDGVHLWVTSVDRASSKGFLQEFAVADGDHGGEYRPAE